MGKKPTEQLYDANKILEKYKLFTQNIWEITKITRTGSWYRIEFIYNTKYYSGEDGCGCGWSDAINETSFIYFKKQSQKLWCIGNSNHYLTLDITKDILYTSEEDMLLKCLKLDKLGDIPQTLKDFEKKGKMEALNNHIDNLQDGLDKAKEEKGKLYNN